jgi:hypothetical protein
MSATVGKNIIAKPVGTRQPNEPGDVKRVQQLLLRSATVSQKRKGFSADGRWNEATEEALAAGLGLAFASLRDAEVRPVEKDPGLLKVAADAGVAAPLLAKAGRAAVLQLHDALQKKGIAYTPDSVVYVTKADGGRWHALFWNVGEGATYVFPSPGASPGCNCTTYANLLLAAFHAPYAGGGAFKAGVAGVGPAAGKSLGDRYGMAKVGRKAGRAAQDFFRAEADPRKLYYLDVGYTGAHCVVAVSPGADRGWKAYHCPASKGAVVAEPLQAYLQGSSYASKDGCGIWEGKEP